MAISRLAGVVPLVGAAVAAMALAGVAVFTVSSAGCAEPGQYVLHGSQIELVGGCVDPADLPVVPQEQRVDPQEPGAVDRLRQVSP